MKLAEALIRRKALKENIEQLKGRLAKVAKVQEGDTPAERPQELPAALEADLQDLQALIIRINRTNSVMISGPPRRHWNSWNEHQG